MGRMSTLAGQRSTVLPPPLAGRGSTALPPPLAGRGSTFLASPLADRGTDKTPSPLASQGSVVVSSPMVSRGSTILPSPLADRGTGKTPSPLAGQGNSVVSCPMVGRGSVTTDRGSAKTPSKLPDQGSTKTPTPLPEGGRLDDLNTELRKLAKSYIATSHTTVSTVELTMIKDFLASVFPVYGCADGTCSVLVHTLTDTNVNKKQMKIPRRAVPDDLAISGPVTVVFHPGVIVVGSYNVLTADDGRVRICCWKNFIDRVGWKAKTKIVMLFCRLDDMTWLFVHPLNAVVMA